MRCHIRVPYRLLFFSLILARVSIPGEGRQNGIIFAKGFDATDRMFMSRHRRRILDSISSVSISRDKNRKKLYKAASKDELGYDAANANTEGTVLNIRSGSTAENVRKSRAQRIIPMLVAVTIGGFSILEIIETQAEMFIGHAHGVFGLSLIRLFREIAILQTQAEEFSEAVEKLVESENDEEKNKKHGILSSFGLTVTRFIVSREVSVLACIMAGMTSLFEVVYDLKPGGHHGAVFLALSELKYQINRYSHIRSARNKGRKQIGAKRLSPVLQLLLGQIWFLAAAAFAAFEIYEDTKPGAHHAVALLAMAELVENLNRSKILDVRVRQNRRFGFFGSTSVTPKHRIGQNIESDITNSDSVL